MRRILDAGSWRQRAVALCAVAALAIATSANAADPAPRSFAEVARDSAQQVVARAWSGAQDVAGFALGLIGVEYRWGGDTPARGLDCSGLIRYVFQQVTGVTLPRTARELARLGDSVALADLRAGDLVFFNTRHFAFSHVGLYLGDNQFIHAPARGREVEITTISSNYWQKHFDGARRLVGVLPALVPSVIPEALASSLPAPAEAVPHDAPHAAESAAHEETP
jgi:cell wall-associated NlpC family hydrolase